MNPFDASLKEKLLYNIATGEAAPKEVKLFLTSVESTGHEIRINMINNYAANEDAFQTYTIKKTQIKNFTSVAKKRRIRVGEKVTEIKIQKDLFGRLLGISIKKKIDIGKVLFNIKTLEIVWKFIVQCYLCFLLHFSKGFNSIH